MNEKNYIERYWRDAKPEDAIKEPPMVARLRDNERQSWRIGKQYLLSRWTKTFEKQQAS